VAEFDGVPRHDGDAAAGNGLTPRARIALAVAAATVLNLPFGSIYAFSVFLRPMEQLLGVGRTQLSLVFGIATVTLTLGMNVAPRLYQTVSPAMLLLASGATGALGLALTAAAGGFAELVVGYGVLFGLGAGIAFTVLQQSANQVPVGNRGLLNGYIVSLYPLGAMIGVPLLGISLAAWGLRATIGLLAAVVLAGGIAAALLLRLARIVVHDDGEAPAAEDAAHGALFAKLFTVFLFAAAAGLTVMSQAAGILQAYGGATALALGGTTFITGAIAAARIGGGWLADRFSVPRVAVGAHLCSLAGALLLVAWPGPLVAVPALAMIGMGYGFVSGLTAAAIAQFWHRARFGQVSSRLYIAWCAAALTLPVLAGWLYDRTHSYDAAVLVAAGVNIAGALVAARLPADGRSIEARK
jgi:OFA family oxalate/formate antiporter-like MFS transporter